jgi:hypothetical protein
MLAVKLVSRKRTYENKCAAFPSAEPMISTKTNVLKYLHTPMT